MKKRDFILFVIVLIVLTVLIAVFAPFDQKPDQKCIDSCFAVNPKSTPVIVGGLCRCQVKSEDVITNETSTRSP